MVPDTTLDSATEVQDDVSSYLIANYLVVAALTVSVRNDIIISIANFARHCRFTSGKW